MTDTLNVEILKEVPFKQQGERPGKAAIARCAVDLTGFSGKELSMLKCLCEAVDMMNVVYWDLADRNFAIVISVVKKMLHCDNLKEEEKKIIENYRDMLLIQNSILAAEPIKNPLLDIPEERAKEIMSLKKRKKRVFFLK